MTLPAGYKLRLRQKRLAVAKSPTTVSTYDHDTRVMLNQCGAIATKFDEHMVPWWASYDAYIQQIRNIQGAIASPAYEPPVPVSSSKSSSRGSTTSGTRVDGATASYNEFNTRVYEPDFLRANDREQAAVRIYSAFAEEWNQSLSRIAHQASFAMRPKTASTVGKKVSSGQAAHPSTTRGGSNPAVKPHKNQVNNDDDSDYSDHANDDDGNSDHDHDDIDDIDDTKVGGKTRITKQARAIFLEWALSHDNNPSPTSRQYDALAALSGYNNKIVRTWFGNYRQRQWNTGKWRRKAGLPARPTPPSYHKSPHASNIINTISSSSSRSRPQRPQRRSRSRAMTATAAPSSIASSSSSIVAMNTDGDEGSDHSNDQKQYQLRGRSSSTSTTTRSRSDGRSAPNRVIVLADDEHSITANNQPLRIVVHDNDGDDDDDDGVLVDSTMIHGDTNDDEYVNVSLSPSSVSSSSSSSMNTTHLTALAVIASDAVTTRPVIDINPESPVRSRSLPLILTPKRNRQPPAAVPSSSSSSAAAVPSSPPLAIRRGQRSRTPSAVAIASAASVAAKKPAVPLYSSTLPSSSSMSSSATAATTPAP